jgi:hypothetical protein
LSGFTWTQVIDSNPLLWRLSAVKRKIAADVLDLTAAYRPHATDMRQ